METTRKQLVEPLKADYEIIIYVIVSEAGDSSLSLTVFFSLRFHMSNPSDEEMSKSKYPVVRHIKCLQEPVIHLSLPYIHCWCLSALFYDLIHVPAI